MQEAEQTLVQEFLSVFNAAAGTYVLELQEGIRFAKGLNSELDALLRLDVQGQAAQIEIAVEVKREVYPRDARNVIDQLSAFNAWRQQTGMASAVPVVVARHITEGAREVLRKSGVNYFEAASGTLFYRHSSWLINIERQSTQPVRRKIGSVFHGAREQVVHALLSHWLHAGKNAWMAGNELAQLAETSPFTVSKTLQELEEHEWVETTGSGPSQRRRLIDASGLLDEWAKVWTYRAAIEPRTRWYTYAAGRGGIVDHMLDRLAGNSNWALTGAAAANAKVPHLTSIDRAMIIVPPQMAEIWAGKMNLERAEKGSNITFVERSGASLLFLDEHPDHPGARVASAFVQYLDLLDGVGRNKELAREYRRRILKMDTEHD